LQLASKETEGLHVTPSPKRNEDNRALASLPISENITPSLAGSLATGRALNAHWTHLSVVTECLS